MIGKLAAQMLDPYFVREEELAEIISRKDKWTRRFKVFNVNSAAGQEFEVPQTHYWYVDLINSTIGTGPAAAAFLGQINFYKPSELTGQGDLTYYACRTDDYAGAVTVFYQIGGGSGFADSTALEYIDMNPILLEPGDRIHAFVDGAAALSSFYGVIWYWEKSGM